MVYPARSRNNTNQRWSGSVEWTDRQKKITVQPKVYIFQLPILEKLKNRYNVIFVPKVYINAVEKQVLSLFKQIDIDSFSISKVYVNMVEKQITSPQLLKVN